MTPLIKAADDLRQELRGLTFPAPVATTYNPLEYAWDRHCEYLTKFGSGKKKVLFLGMNPGPYGMAQTGVPFGEIPHVRDWMGISGPVGKPDPEHNKRPITGFDCERSEVSGRRLWGLFAELFGSADEFFKDHFVANFCPLVWMKDTAVGFQFSCSRPLMKHEDILVFSFGVNYSAKRSKRRATYNDQHAVPIIRVGRGKTKIKYLGRGFRGHAKGQEYVGRTNCQNTILNYPKDSRKSGEKAHPFAKPLALLEHLVRTYSNEGDVVLDNTMGSGSTCIAAMRSGRQSIGIEMDREWFDFATRRVEIELLAESHAKDAA